MPPQFSDSIKDVVKVVSGIAIGLAVSVPANRPVPFGRPYGPQLYAGFQPGNKLYVQGFGWFDDERVKIRIFNEAEITSNGEMVNSSPREIADFTVGSTMMFALTFPFHNLQGVRPPHLLKPFLLAWGRKYHTFVEAKIDISGLWALDL